MKILSYLNISNVNDIECDSGYIFNYTLYNSFVKDKIDFKIILPEELKEQKIRFLNKDVFFTNMGKTKYKTRYFFPWDEMYRIILDFAPDVIFINQCELTSSIKALLIENNLSKIKLVSGGQKAKLIFLNMVLKGCNVLILDEPTRNFSPLSAPIVRQALYEFNGTIISISHDRKYLDEVADIIYVLTESGLSQL